MPPRCPACETLNDQTADYCMGCGTALLEDAGFDVGSFVRGTGRQTGVALVAMVAALFRLFLSSTTE